MATYITLMRWTGQGIARVKDSPKRLDAGRKAFKKMGVEIKDTWLTMGKYDLVCVIEGMMPRLPERCFTWLAYGNANRKRCAWNEDEYREITKSV